MNLCRWMSGWLAATFLLGETALLHWTLSSGVEWPHPASVAMLGIALAGLSWVGGWVVFGRANIAVRCVVLLLTQLLVAYLGSRTAAGRQASWALAIGIYSAFLLGGLLVGRCCGLSLRWGSGSNLAGPHHRQSSKPQYTIWQLLSVTTAIAALLAFWTHRSLNWSVAQQSLFFFGFLASLAMASLWSGLRGQIGFNVVLLAGGLAGASAWFHWMQYRGLDHVSLMSLALVLQTVLIGSSLVLRSGGLRLDTSAGRIRAASHAAVNIDG